ncbi:MAG: monovalent cation:proton antiporter-2 (CPA2) family protein [Rhodospirillales bacterium]
MPDTHYVFDVLILLVAAVVAVPLFQKLRLGPILGYLVAGALIGPYAFGLVGDMARTQAIAELGIVFLMFTIGLELSFDTLKKIGARVYALGSAQILLTAGIIHGIALLAGLPAPAALILGGGLALSSTAVVMKVLADKGQAKTDFGRTVTAVLVLQDLAVCPLLVLLAVLGEGEGLGPQLWIALGFAGLKAAGAILAIIGLGRFLMRPVCRLIASARSPEIFAAMAILVALGTAWATEQASLSMAFGAFLAGLVLGETEFRHQVAADIEPYRGLLLGLFFMTVGMTIDPGLFLESPTLVLGLTVGLMVLKGAIIAGLGRLFRYSFWRSLRLAGALNQGGEFAFVLIGIGTASGVIDPSANLLVLVVALSMAITPIYANLANRFGQAIQRDEAAQGTGLEHQAEHLDKHVIVVGFGAVGEIVARMLTAHGIPFLVLDESPRRIYGGRAKGYPVFYGDATNETVLHAAGIDHAKALIVATAAEGVAESLSELIRQGFPACRILARGGDERSAAELRRAGLHVVVSEKMECGLQLAGAVQDLMVEG